jgi:hypothetical protein
MFGTSYEVRLYACRYAKLYKVHMGCPREIPRDPGDGWGIFKAHKTKSCSHNLYCHVFFCWDVVDVVFPTCLKNGYLDLILDQI